MKYSSFLITTYFPTDLSTTIPVMYPIYDFSGNLSVKTAWFHLMILLKLSECDIGSYLKWLEKIGRIRWNMKNWHILGIPYTTFSTLSVKTAWLQLIFLLLKLSGYNIWVVPDGLKNWEDKWEYENSTYFVGEPLPLYVSGIVMFIVLKALSSRYYVGMVWLTLPKFFILVSRT